MKGARGLVEYLTRVARHPFFFSELTLWLVAIAGSVAFVWPLWREPSALYLDRHFGYDALMNIDDLRAIHQNFFSALFSGHFHDRLYDSSFYFPQPRPLVTSELQLLAALVTLPFYKSPVLAHSVLLVLALTLDCVGAAKCAQALGAGKWARLVAGVGFAFSAYSGYESGRVQLLYLFPIPFAVAALVHWARTSSTKHAVYVALWLFALTQLCLYYAMFACVLLPGLAVALRLSYARAHLLRDFAVLAGAALVMSLPAAFILAPYLSFGDDLVVARHEEAWRQMNDFVFFTWADAPSYWGKTLIDRWENDSAHFPGAVISLLASLALVMAFVRHRSAAFAMLVCAAIPLLPFWSVGTGVWIAGVVACASAVYLVRTDRAHASFPALVVLFVLGAFLFGGHWPEFFGYPLDGRPYTWLSDHLPFVGAIRVARRAGAIIHLALCCLAALALTHVRMKELALGLALLACAASYAEAFPHELGASNITMRCEDPIYDFARNHEIRAFGELLEIPEAHPIRTMHRVQAAACGVRTSMGQSGITPPLVTAVEDAISILPERGAHAWLWDAGVRWILLRGGQRWRDVRRGLWGTHVRRVLETRGATFIELLPAATHSRALPSTLSGTRIAPITADCSEPQSCEYLVDGDDTTRWTTARPQSADEVIVLRFFDQRVRGVEWSARGYGPEIPRGLRFEYVGEDGRYHAWASYPTISPAVLGQRPGRTSLAFALPEVLTSTIRITQTGRTRSIPLSATEIAILGAP